MVSALGQFFTGSNKEVVLDTEKGIIRGRGKEEWTATAWKTPQDEIPLNELTFVGSHNALIIKDEGYGHLFNQVWSLEQQLELGVRVLEFDIGHFDDDSLRICHNPPEVCKKIAGPNSYPLFSTKLKVVMDWVEKNENEIVILTLDIKRDKNITPRHLDEVIGAHASQIFTQQDLDKLGHMPTIGEMKALKKRVILINPKTEKSAYTIPRFDILLSTAPSIKPEGLRLKLDKKKTANGSEELQSIDDKKLFMLQHNSQIPNEIYSAVCGALKKNQPGKLGLSDNKVNTIMDGVEHGDFRKQIPNRRPNIIMVDRVNRLIREGIFDVVNQWNEEAAANAKKK